MFLTSSCFVGANLRKLCFSKVSEFFVQICPKWSEKCPKFKRLKFFVSYVSKLATDAVAAVLEYYAWISCQVPVRLSPRPSRSIDFGNVAVSETNVSPKTAWPRQNFEAWELGKYFPTVASCIPYRPLMGVMPHLCLLRSISRFVHDRQQQALNLARRSAIRVEYLVPGNVFFKNLFVIATMRLKRKQILQSDKLQTNNSEVYICYLSYVQYCIGS